MDLMGDALDAIEVQSIIVCSQDIGPDFDDDGFACVKDILTKMFLHSQPVKTNA
jgi:hypothetical protein